MSNTSPTQHQAGASSPPAPQEEVTMDGMPPTHARRQGWTGAELFLAYAYALLCPAIGFFAFVEIYQTATHLVHPWFGDWAWIVPLSAEGMFTALYCGWVLLELRDDPPARVRVLLGVFLAACGAASYALQILAARGIVADALAHAIVVTAFFGVLIFGKVLVRRLKVTPAARALEAAMADARQHAIDLVRDRRGRLWRFGVPSLLRRQILAGRLPDEVRSEVAMKVSMGRTSGWESAVRGWVLRELEFGAQAEKDAERVRQDIARQPVEPATQTAAGRPSEAVSGTPAEAPSQTGPRTPPRAPSQTGARKPSKAAVRRMTAEQLAEFVRPLLDATPDLTKTGVMESLHCGREKAEAALKLAQDASRKDLMTGVPVSARS